MRKLSNCLACGMLTNNPKYCSRSCAASINNKATPKRKRVLKIYYCRHCGDEISVGYSSKKSCSKCNHNIKDWSQVTYTAFKAKRGIFQAHARIRSLARQAYKRTNLPRHCTICDYRNHFEVCHRKSIADFPDNTVISVINDPSNLVALCPNCHWDFDHGLLELS